MTNRCDCGARQGDPHLPACHPADRSDYDANIPAVADAARAMLAALELVRRQPMAAAALASAGAFDTITATIAQAKAAGITTP